MDRRNFIKTGGGVAAAAVAGTALADQPAPTAQTAAMPAPAVQSSAQRLVMTAEPGWDQHLVAETAARLAVSLAAASDGELQIEWIEGDETGFGGAPPGGEVDVQLGFLAEPVAAQPALAWFAGLPGRQGLAAAEHDAWLSVGGGQMLWDAVGAELGFKPLLMGHATAGTELWASRALAAPHDLRGTSVLAHGLAGDVLARIGARAVDVGRTGCAEAKALLASGRVVAVEVSCPFAALCADLHQVAPWRHPIALHGYGRPLSLTIRSARWDRLTRSQKTLFDGIVARERQLSEAALRTHRRLAVTCLLPANGIVAQAGTEDIEQALDAAAAELVARVADATPEARRVHDSFTAFKTLMDAGGSLQDEPRVG